jgi:hypothetical protein
MIRKKHPLHRESKNNNKTPPLEARSAQRAIVSKFGYEYGRFSYSSKYSKYAEGLLICLVFIFTTVYCYCMMAVLNTCMLYW